MPGMWKDGKGTLTGDGQETVMVGLSVLQESVAANNFEKGWRVRDEDMPLGTAPKRPVSELIALLHSEVTEAFEAYRNNEPELWYEVPGSSDTVNFEQKAADGSDDIVLGKPQGITSELADVIIRVLDMADELNLSLALAVIQKHRYNQTRPYRHGGKLA